MPLTSKKRLALLLPSLVLLTACGTSPITSQTPGLWEKLVYFISQAIESLSFGNVGIGIVLFTLIMRTLLLPIYQMQMTSSQKIQELQPQLKALQQEYSGRDLESRTRLSEATTKLYKDNGVNMFASFIPILVQMPILLALFQALTRVDTLQHGTFLWLDIAKPDPTYIFPFLAAFFTFLSSWLIQKAAKEKNMVMRVMSMVMPAIVFISAQGFASGVSLYWAISYAYQVVQTLIFNNPFVIIKERQEVQAAEIRQQKKRRKAMLKAKKRR